VVNSAYEKKTIWYFCNSAIDFDICFNASKSKMLYFGNYTKVNVFKLCGKDIEIVTHEKHLGNLIGKNTLEKQIQQNVNDLYSNVNMLMAQFSSASIDTKYRLFKSFCMSVYSSQLWDFSSTMCEKFFVAWRKCIRRLLSISPRTHSVLLHLICLDIQVDVQLHLQFLKFMTSCIKSDNVCVKIIIW